ncbi:MAG: DNA translocase FtsK 4TM domain-containing protein, partial [Oscillospiraceae bacterium]
VLFGVFGWGTYLVAPIIIYIAVLVAMGKPFKIRLIQLVIAMVIFCGATVVFSKYQVFGTPNFEEQGIELWNMAVERKMGGAISMLLGWGVLALFGRPVATIFMVVLILVLFMLVTNITPVDIFIFIKRHIVNAKETAKSVAQDSIGKYEINLNPTEKRKRKKDSDAYDYEDAPELKDEKEEPDFSPVYTAPQPQFDTFSKRGTQAQKPQPKPKPQPQPKPKPK